MKSLHNSIHPLVWISIKSFCLSSICTVVLNMLPLQGNIPCDDLSAFNHADYPFVNAILYCLCLMSFFSLKEEMEKRISLLFLTKVFFVGFLLWLGCTLFLSWIDEILIHMESAATSPTGLDAVASSGLDCAYKTATPAIYGMFGGIGPWLFAALIFFLGITFLFNLFFKFAHGKQKYFTGLILLSSLLNAWQMFAFKEVFALYKDLYGGSGAGQLQLLHLISLVLFHAIPSLLLMLYLRLHTAPELRKRFVVP